MTQCQHQQAYRHVNKKGVSPAEPGDICRYQPAATHLPDDKRHAANPPIQADSAGMGRTFEGHVQRCENLRHDQRRAHPLQGARREQGGDGVGDTAQQRGDPEQRHAP